MRSVGIDIGSSSIKVVEITQSNKGLAITRYLEHSLAQGSANDSTIEVLEFLRNLKAGYPGDTKLIMGLRQDRVAVRHKIFPFADRQKILRSLPFELEEDLPFSSETAVYDAKVIRYIGPTAEVLACASPKNRINEMVTLMQDTLIDSPILSAEGVAFANCIENWNDPIPAAPAATMSLEESATPKRTLRIHLHIGHSQTLVCAFEGQNLVGARTVLWGGKNVIEAISRRYEIPLVEAIKEMETKAFILLSREGASYDQVVFSDTISTQVKELAQEIKITLLDLQSELNGHVEGILISGGASQIRNLNGFLTQQLELAVNPLPLFSRFQTQGVENNPAIEAKMGVALGLAIEGLKKPRNPALNFLRGEYARQNKAMQVFWNRWGDAVKVGAAAFLIFCIYTALRESITSTLTESAIDTLRTQAKTSAKLPTKMANESGVKKFIKEEKRKAQEIKSYNNLIQMNSALDILSKVNEAAPRKDAITLNVKKFIVSENLVTLEGTLANAGQISALQSSLQKVARDGKVTTAAPTIRADMGTVPFAFSFQVERFPGDQKGKAE